MATLVSVVSLVLTGHPLTPVNVFMLISFINVLRLSTCIFLAYGLLGTYDAYASLGRIEDFLLLENLPAISRGQKPTGDSNDTKEENPAKSTSDKGAYRDPAKKDVFKTDQGNDPDKPVALCVSSMTYRQFNRENEFILKDIEFTTPSGRLTVVTGPVGSGKSTLLSAIAGEVSNISGTINCQGTIVYVPQVAWVFSGTIKKNILFSLPYDEQKYTKIIHACALKQDLQQFPDHDQTVVGERGAVLSGGQQARVNLARAVYADGDVYLLDDPLSAVDFKVGRHIFEKCIKDLLGDKIRVLTSHQEQQMREADEVIVLYKGCVLGKGSFDELRENSILNTTVDPLYKGAPREKEPEEAVEDEEGGETTGSLDTVVAPSSDALGLQISQEDRTIGVVSSKLYWDYFRSGMHPLVFLAIVCLCLITQGKTQCS